MRSFSPMIPSSEQVYGIDWSQVKKSVVQSLGSGRARIINGVARDVENDYRILQHMPFRPLALDRAEDLARVAERAQDLRVLEQTTAMLQTTIAISTAVTVGSVIVCTAYLAKKLKDLEAKIGKLEDELKGQNLVYYATKASVYFGAVEATRELIADPRVVKENPDLVVITIARLSGQRHETDAFLGNLFRLFEELTPHHQAIALDFFHATLDFAPKAAFIESQAAYKLERFRLGDHILMAARRNHEARLRDYKAWANERLKRLVGGKGLGSDTTLAERLDDAKRILSSEENRLLLERSV